MKATGVVSQDTYNFGPYAAIQMGDAVEVSFEVNLPPTIINPGTEHEYGLVGATFQIMSGGMTFSGSAGGGINLVVENDNPSLDGVGYSSSMGNGDFFAFSADLPGTTFASPDLSMLTGSYDIATLSLASQMRFTGAGGFMGMTFQTLEVQNLGFAQSFCNPNNNSTGLPCLLSASNGMGVGSGLHLDASQGPPLAFGYFLVGNGTPTSGAPLSLGILCLAAAPSSIGRYNVTGGALNSVGQFDASGILQNAVGTSTSGSGFDVPSVFSIAGSPMIMTGQTWHFQLWYRDGSATSNLSDGVSVTF